MNEDFATPIKDITPPPPTQCKKGHTLHYEFFSDGGALFAFGPWCDCIDDIIPQSFYKVNALDTPHEAIPKAKELSHERGKCVICKSPVVYRYEWHNQGLYWFSPARGYCRCAGKSLDEIRGLAGVLLEDIWKPDAKKAREKWGVVAHNKDAPPIINLLAQQEVLTNTEDEVVSTHDQ